MARQNLTRLVSPFGIASWPALNTPDEYEGKKSWKVDLLLEPGAETDNFIEQLDAEYKSSVDAAKADIDANPTDGSGRKRKVEAANPPFWPEVDRETNEETGRMVVRFRSSAEYKDRRTGEMKPIRLPLVDGLKAPMTETIGGGSLIRIVTDLFPYYINGKAGMSCRLAVVQVKELCNGFAAATDALDAIDDGFVTDVSAATGEDY